MSAAIAAAFALGAGIKVIYCTDEYLVIHSDGTPNHPTYLEYIQRPPGSVASGAKYEDQCVTRGMKTQVRAPRGWAASSRTPTWHGLARADHTCRPADHCCAPSCMQWLISKVPLSPVPLSTASATVNNVASFPSSTDMLTGVALPKGGPTSTTTSGLPLFPAYND